MMDERGRFVPISKEQAQRLMRDKRGEFIAHEGEHVILKGREFTVEGITDELLMLRPVRQVPGGRTLPGPIPSERV